MMKPHVWVVGAGWPGDFELDTEERWLIWEKSYRKYILRMAEVADSLDVELFCIGTEYRKAAAQRESFWRELIHEVQDIYDGPITYAANWDNYANIKFWDELDYIGIDAYFQLSKKREPSKKVMKKELNKIKVELKDFSEVQDREIIFTEYGYKSVDYLFNGDWESGGNTLAFNESNQRRAYECFFETIWEGDWMKGGFLWKWHLYARDKQTGKGNKRYTPQNKAAQQVIRKYYSKAN